MDENVKGMPDQSSAGAMPGWPDAGSVAFQEAFNFLLSTSPSQLGQDGLDARHTAEKIVKARMEAHLKAMQ